MRSHNAHAALLPVGLVGLLLLAGCSQQSSAESVPTTEEVPVRTAKIVEEIQADCSSKPNPENCFQEAVVQTAMDEGPEIATSMLTNLIQSGSMRGSSDYHDLSHKIGRATAKVLGVNPEAFRS